MPIAVGQRFVRRHNAARTSTANGTAADIDYDTSVISEGDYSWSSPEVTVDTAGKYLCVFDLGRVVISSTRAVGTLVPSINETDQVRFRATHRYVRNSGGANEAASIGMAILDLAANDDVKIRNPGALSPTDAVNNYATDSGAGGGFQLIRLPDGNFTHVERTTDATEVGTSNINTTRPWLVNSGTWTKITYNSEVADDDSLYPGTGGDVTLAADTKYLILWGATCYSTDGSRHTYVTGLNIDGDRVQTGSGYQRNTASQGPPMCGMYLHETGGSTETLYLEATHETEGGDAGTPNVSDAYLQVIELPSSAEWIHVDNGTTDSLTTALASSTFDNTPISSTYRADGDSNLSLDDANEGVQNDSGDSLPVLAIGWHRWDRDSGSSGTRKNPWMRWNNGGFTLGYGIAGAFSRGQQSGDDTFQAHYCSAATMTMADEADLKMQVQDLASTSNADMGIYASTSRFFLGIQVLNLETLVSAQSYTLTAESGSFSMSGTAADLEASRSLDAESVTFTYSGTDAGLNRALTIDAESGSYAHSGTDADLERGLVMAGESGSFALAGTDAALTHVQGYELIAESATFVHSGTDVDLLVSVVLTAESGTFTKAGTDAGLIRSVTLEGESGVYSYVGAEAALSAGNSLAAESGSYAISGTDAALEAAHTLQGESGSYALTGTIADLVYAGSYTLDAESGTFTLTGSIAGLEASKVMDGESGAYSLTGTLVALPVARALDSESGSYVLTGTIADLQYAGQYFLTAETGSYALTGAENQFARALVMDGESGSYALSGTDANLNYGQVYTLDAETGAYVLSGTDAALARSLIMAGESGSYISVGTDATLTYVQANTLLGETGVFTLAGTDVGLERSLVVAGEAGSYSIVGATNVLAYGRQMDAEAGSYELTGTDNQFDRTRVLLGYTGTYSINTPDGRLDYNFIADLYPAQYDLTDVDRDVLIDLIDGKVGWGL